MKKLVVMPLILSVAFLVTACGPESVEQAKNEMINNAASVQLDELIKDKVAAAADATTDMAEDAADAAIDAGAAAVQEATGATDAIIDTGADMAKDAVDAVAQ